MKEQYTIIFHALSRFGNLHTLGQFFADERDEVDGLIDKGKKEFGKHLRSTDNMRVFVLDDAGNTLADFTFEPSECKIK